MNRLHHLKVTLGKNICDNRSYPHLEFIVLDYNSQDGLEKFILDEFLEEIRSGRLKYFRTDQPEKYNMSHSRNMAFNAATGEVLCNIDSDNFTGKDFAHYVNDIFNRNKNAFLSTHSGGKVKGDVLGRICVKKEHFLKTRGYDERMKHYGFDDYDFVNRLQMLGISKLLISDAGFLNAIQHSNEERLRNFKGTDLATLLVGYQTPYSSKLMLLFGSGRFCAATMVNNFHQRALAEGVCNASWPVFNFSITENEWQEGRWKKNKRGLHFFSAGSVEAALIRQDAHRFIEEESQSIFHVITDPHTKAVAHFFYSQISNRIIMEENLRKKNFAVNQTGFGLGRISTAYTY